MDHLVNDMELFSNIEDLGTPIKVYVAKTKEFLTATKKGSIFIYFDNCNKYRSAEIKNVLYVK